MQHPTCENTRIRSVQDAQRIFLAVQQGLLHMVTRRLDADERLALTSGCVYAWEERGPHSEVTGMGIERFTEGRRWSPSRVRDEFLFYYEKYLPVGEAGQSSVNADRQAPPDWDQLVKQTYSVWVGAGNGKRKWHLTAYFTHQTVDNLKTIDDIPGISTIPIPDNMFQSTRVSKSRNASVATSPREAVPAKQKDPPPPVARTYAAFPPPYSAPLAPTSEHDAAQAPIQSRSRSSTYAPEPYYVENQNRGEYMARQIGTSLPSTSRDAEYGGCKPPSRSRENSRYSPEDRHARRQLPSTEGSQHSRRASSYHPYAPPGRNSYHPQASSSSSLIDYDNYDRTSQDPRASRSPRHTRQPSLPGPSILTSIAYAQQPPYDNSQAMAVQVEPPLPSQAIYSGWTSTPPPQPLEPQHASEMRVHASPPSQYALEPSLALASSPTSSSSSSYTQHSVYLAECVPGTPLDGRATPYFEHKQLPPLESIRLRPYKRAPMDDEALRMLQVANKTPPRV